MIWLFVIMLLLFVLSVPIGWSMAIAAAAYMAFGYAKSSGREGVYSVVPGRAC